MVDVSVSTQKLHVKFNIQHAAGSKSPYLVKIYLKYMIDVSVSTQILY